MGASLSPKDWTADEIAQWCELDRHQIGRRLGEMYCRGLIRKTNNTRPTPTGRAAQCYEVVNQEKVDP